MKFNINLDSIKKKLISEKDISINDNILLIDGSNRFISCFSVSQDVNLIGQHVGGITTFLKSIAKIIRDISPSRVIILFDGKNNSNKRQKKSKDYKKNRSNRTSLNKYFLFETIEEEKKSIETQILRLIDYLEYLPVTIMAIDDVEADDVISYIINKCKYKKATIVSNDKDFIQLINDNVSIFDPIKKIIFDTKTVKETYKVSPNNFINYKILLGDTSDNIKGINGVGKKSIEKLHFLLNDTYYTFNDILSFKNKDNEKIIYKIEQQKHIYDLNYELMQLQVNDFALDVSSIVHNIYNGSINEYKPSKIRSYIAIDKIEHLFVGIDTWLLPFNRLDTIRKRSLNEQ